MSGLAPEVVELIKALARANAARDIARQRKEIPDRADSHLRPLFQSSPE
jgi:hypothetical protein